MIINIHHGFLEGFHLINTSETVSKCYVVYKYIFHQLDINQSITLFTSDVTNKNSKSIYNKSYPSSLTIHSNKYKCFNRLENPCMCYPISKSHPHIHDFTLLYTLVLQSLNNCVKLYCT